jgi:hypothetical protein
LILCKLEKNLSPCLLWCHGSLVCPSTWRGTAKRSCSIRLDVPNRKTPGHFEEFCKEQGEARKDFHHWYWKDFVLQSPANFASVYGGPMLCFLLWCPWLPVDWDIDLFMEALLRKRFSGESKSLCGIVQLNDLDSDS